MHYGFSMSIELMPTSIKSDLFLDQEKGLENLSQIISRQKNIATTITTEVDLQNGKFVNHLPTFMHFLCWNFRNH